MSNRKYKRTRERLSKKAQGIREKDIDLWRRQVNLLVKMCNVKIKDTKWSPGWI